MSRFLALQCHMSESPTLRRQLVAYFQISIGNLAGEDRFDACVEQRATRP
jgi:hypothetical protein